MNVSKIVSISPFDLFEVDVKALKLATFYCLVSVPQEARHTNLVFMLARATSLSTEITFIFWDLSL